MDPPAHRPRVFFCAAEYDRAMAILLQRGKWRIYGDSLICNPIVIYKYLKILMKTPISRDSGTPAESRFLFQYFYTTAP
ncbi:hypothetical protein [Sphingopyxis sp.]|jgi:hypothetical protein|uniref:hypothetical protein n=1 Tax=Sphingopyxis sp. TaxID=1908224 RepID=UPI003F6EDC12